MKEMIKKVREEKGGFTLAELLIVVAIIAVLVAIAIPVFTSALHNSKAAADEANCRAVYADLQADYLANTNAEWYKSAQTTGMDGKTGISGTTVTFSDGQVQDLSDACGSAASNFTPDHGWNVTYECNNSSDGHKESWGYTA